MFKSQSFEGTGKMGEKEKLVTFAVSAARYVTCLLVNILVSKHCTCEDKVILILALITWQQELMLCVFRQHVELFLLNQLQYIFQIPTKHAPCEAATEQKQAFSISDVLG